MDEVQGLAGSVSSLEQAKAYSTTDQEKGRVVVEAGFCIVRDEIRGVREDVLIGQSARRVGAGRCISPFERAEEQFVEGDIELCGSGLSRIVCQSLVLRRALREALYAA